VTPATPTPVASPQAAATILVTGSVCGTVAGGAAFPDGQGRGVVRWVQFCSNGTMITGRSQPLNN
jgi:hypothetical protein